MWMIAEPLRERRKWTNNERGGRGNCIEERVPVSRISVERADDLEDGGVGAARDLEHVSNESARILRGGSRLDLNLIAGLGAEEMLLGEEDGGTGVEGEGVGA